MSSRLKAAVLVVAFAAGFAAPAIGQRQPPVQRQALAMLDRLESGRWELRRREAGAEVEQLCVRDGRRLLQLRHQAAVCERLIVSDASTEVTVQYTCRGHGYGRTRIRRETGRLVQIETQGIVDGLPFAFAAEARRVGECAT